MASASASERFVEFRHRIQWLLAPIGTHAAHAFSAASWPFSNNHGKRFEQAQAAAKTGHTTNDHKQTIEKKEEEATAARSSATRERCEKQIPNWNERNAPSN